MTADHQAALIHDVTLEETELAGPYAEAAWQAAKAVGRQNDLVEEMEAFVRTTDENATGFAAFARLGTISDRERTKVVESLQDQIGDQSFRLLISLCQHGRLSLYRAVAALLRDHAGAAAGHVPVIATTAAPLDDGRKERLRAALAARLGAAPVLTFVVDPEIVGGLQVRVGETLYDHSVRANLARLRSDLLEKRP